jgi:CRP-like cAMP-binding protein
VISITVRVIDPVLYFPRMRIRRTRPVPGFSAHEVARLAGAKRMRFASGSRLFREGEKPPGVFVLYDGLAELSMTGDKNASVFVGFATAGEMMGLSDTISGQASALTATAIRPCDVAFVNRDDFLRYIREHRWACFQTVRQLGKELNTVYRRARAF